MRKIFILIILSITATLFSQEKVKIVFQNNFLGEAMAFMHQILISTLFSSMYNSPRFSSI